MIFVIAGGRDPTAGRRTARIPVELRGALDAYRIT